MSVKMFYGLYQFVPVPIFSWNTETVRDSALNEIFLRHTLDFTGVLLGSPSESGTFDQLFQKKTQLQQALASGHKHFRILSNNNTVLSGVFPRVNNVSIAEGVWANRIDYTFSLEYDEDFYNNSIQSYNESWAFEESDDRRSATARHDISSVGLNTNPSGINNAFVNAKSFVLGKTGYANVIAGTPAFVQVSGVSFNAYEELRTEQADVQAASYGVSEVYTLSSGNFIHTFNGALQQAEDGIRTINLDGNIRGLGRGDVAFTRALSAWNTKVKTKLPLLASGIYLELGGDATLFTNNFKNLNITRNSFAGILSYSASFTDSEADNLPSGIQDFTLTISDQLPIRIFASFAIPERSLGNVVQDISTTSEGTFSIQGNAIGKQGFTFSDLLSFVQDKINQNRPNPASYITLRLDQKQLNKDFDKNTVQFNVSWKYTKDLSSAELGNQDIILN